MIRIQSIPSAWSYCFLIPPFVMAGCVPVKITEAPPTTLSADSQLGLTVKQDPGTRLQSDVNVGAAHVGIAHDGSLHVQAQGVPGKEPLGLDLKNGKMSHSWDPKYSLPVTLSINAESFKKLADELQIRPTTPLWTAEGAREAFNPGFPK